MSELGIFQYFLRCYHDESSSRSPFGNIKDALIGRTHDTPNAPVCRYLYDVMHDSSLWRTVYSNAEFTIHSFNSLFRHDTDLRHLGFRHSQRPLTFITDAFFIEQKLMNCCNLISLDLGYNTSISSLRFVRHMPSLRGLDILSCQNITLERLVTSLYKKKIH